MKVTVLMVGSGSPACTVRVTKMVRLAPGASGWAEVEAAGVDRGHAGIDTCRAGLLQRVVDDDVAEQGVGDALDEQRHGPGVGDGQRVGDGVAHLGEAR